jgi:hypothetical protein
MFLFCLLHRKGEVFTTKEKWKESLYAPSLSVRVSMSTSWTLGPKKCKLKLSSTLGEGTVNVAMKDREEG